MTVHTIDDAPPPGHEWVWVPESALPSSLPWEVVSPASSRQCRHQAAGKRCEGRSVARLQRGSDVKQWWHYCVDHLYGRQIRGGIVFVRIAQPTLPSEVAR